MANKALSFLASILLFAFPASYADTSLENAATEPHNPFVTPDALFVSGTGISRYERDSFKQTWRVLPRLQTFEPVVVGESVYIGSTAGLYALDSHTGKVLWHVESASPVYSPVAKGGLLYSGSRDGVLRAVRSDSGKLVWRQQLEGWIYPPVVQAETLIAGGSAALLYALNIENGDLIWTKPLPQELVYRPVASGADFVLATTFSGDVVAVNTEHGKTVWRTKDSSAGFPPLVLADRIFVGTFDGWLRARRLHDGALLWETEVGGNLSHLPQASGNTLLVASAQGRAAAVDINTGNLLWSVEVPHSIEGSPALINHKISIPVENGRLFILHDSFLASIQ